MSTSELIFASSRALGLAGLGAALAVAVFVAVKTERAPAPRFGVRGQLRRRARASAWFSCLEPAMSFLAGLLIPVRSRALDEYLTRVLREAGQPAGLSADELVGLSLLASLLGAVLGVSLAVPGMGLCLSALGAILPVLRVLAMASARARSLERSLPNAIDLCTLCMGAGADFPAALHFVQRHLGRSDAACRDELERVLGELALGHTRVQALRELGNRTCSHAVREFVNAVCRSEQKGTPLLEVLSIQAVTLRQRRSVRAEELAARAGVKMLLPLLLMVASLLLVIFAPLIIGGTGL